MLEEIDSKRLALHKLIATQHAEALGHVLGPWHRRSNDPLERCNAYCVRCNMIAVAGVDEHEGIEVIYGHAVRRECKR